MPVDLEYLRQHYASLSDDALLAVNRADLVESAQKCFDDELARRNLASRRTGRRTDLGPATPASPDSSEQNAEIDGEYLDDADEPDWIEDAAEAYSQIDFPGRAPAPELANARDALEAAGIPCHVQLTETPEDQSPKPTHIWRLLVPGNLNLRATSILDRDIFNADFENDWKTHLETLSDDDLRAMNPQVTFCGLFDRVARVTNAYDEELARRGLKPEPA